MLSSPAKPFPVSVETPLRRKNRCCKTGGQEARITEKTAKNISSVTHFY
jgi:hypothetical protein